MMRFSLALCALVLSLHAQFVLAGASPLEQLASHYPVRWLWEPVTRLEPGSEGVKRGSLDDEGQALLLQAGAVAQLRLQPDYWLRLAAVADDEGAMVDSAGGVVMPSPPELWLSRGNGLFVPAQLQPGAQAGEWLLPPTTSSTAILLLENTGSRPVRWKLGRAIPDRAARLYPYREPVADQDEERHWFFRPRRGEHLQMSRLAAGDEYQVVLQGPGQWRLEARTLFGNDSNWQRFIDLPLQRNGRYWRDWRLHPVIKHDDTLQSSQCEMLGSVPESLYITLPEGEHSISFIAPRGMAVRALELTRDDFLFARNQPTPDIADLVERYDLMAQPAAQASYDEAHFAALLDAPYPVLPLPRSADQVQPGQSSLFAASRLVERRYRFWRPLPVAGSRQVPGRADLIDVALREPLSGKRRYVANAATEKASREVLLRLAPGESLELDTPDERPVTRLKLSLPVTATAYDLILSNRRGEETVWRWRPGLMKTGELDVVNRSDLARLLSSAADADVATASATFAVNRDDFPISVSHNAGHVIWFSPFYRENVGEGLEQVAWQRALGQLGKEQMLSLLLLDERPMITDSADALQQQRVKVWDDWRPLRGWLHSYQTLWSRRLVAAAPAADMPAPDQLPTLQELRRGDSGHISRQLLKGVAVRGADPAQQQQALDLLQAHYRETGDRANLSAYHSWRFRQAPRLQSQALADWLLISGLEAMAARLYQLAGTPDTHLPYQQALLDSGWSAQPASTNPLISTWGAIWRQDWRAAREYGKGLDPEHPWRVFLSRMPDQPAAIDWLTWAQQAPSTVIDGLPARTTKKLTATQSAGTLQFEVSERDQQIQRFLARPDSPVRYNVVGPVELRLTVNLHHGDPRGTLSDWIEISSNGEERLLPVIDSAVNPRIRQLTPAEASYAGRPYQASLSLGPGRHELSIRPREHNALVDTRIVSPLLLSALVNGLQQEVARVPATSYAIDELVSQLDIVPLEGCEGPSSRDSFAGAVLPGAMGYSVGGVPLATQWQAPHTLASAGASHRENPTSTDEVEQYLLHTLWQWPQLDEQQRERIIARANALASPHIEHAEVRQLVGKLNQDFTWHLEETITASAGSRRVQALGSSEHPVVAMREMLFQTAPGRHEQRLEGRSHSGLFTRFNEPTEVRIKLRQAHLPYQQAPPASVLVTLNERLLERIVLPPLQQMFSITVPPGPQQLRLQLERPSSDHWLYVQAQAHLEGQWQPLFQPRQRRYQVATQAQPLEIYFPGPRWLRIDEYRDGSITHRYQWQASSGSLELTPSQGRSRAMYRVFSWRPRSDPGPLQPYVFEESQSGSAGAVVPPQGPAGLASAQVSATPAPTYRWRPDERIQGSARSTDGLYLQYQSRLDLDNDASGEDDERFFETGWRHRRALDCLACYWRSELFVRTHEDDGIDVLGTRQWLRGDWVQSSWRWELKQSLWYQSDPETDWSWHGAATVVNTHGINEKLEHEYQLQVFGRYLSADDPDYPVDNDIYTRYKDQHQYGAKMSAGLRGRPWLDSLWTARASLSTNEDFNPVDPDYIQASVAWRQYWQPLALTATYRHRLYLDDDDRDSNEHRPVLGLAANALSAFPGGLLLQWGGRLDYDLDRGEYGFMLTLSLDQSRGRGLRDFYPGRSSFHSLRSRDISDDLYHHQMTSGSDNDR